MWLSFWRSRDRFSLEELRYLTEQLQKAQIVNEFNKDFVIEALRSIAELLTYGDQHDSAFFEFFMEKQVMGDFVRILKVSRTVAVSLQLLQTMSIMIQNLKNERAIYYMFSNEHINYLITYSFDFRNEELLSYYISFLRAISGKLNKNTISLLLKTQNEEIVSFPLYSEAIQFAFHEENMVRIAVRALTLNVYHVGDDSVNRFITSDPYAEYFSNFVKFFCKQCIDLDRLVSHTNKNPSPDSTSTILAAVDEIEDNLYYFSDIVSAGIPDVGRLITDHILQLLIFPLLLPSLRIDTMNERKIGAVTCLYLLCCILRIVKIKDLANTIAAALFCPPEAYISNFQAKLNGYMPAHVFTYDYKQSDDNVSGMEDGHLRVTVSDMATSSQVFPEDVITQNDCSISHFALRESLLSYVTSGDDVQASGSLSVLATLLQTKELDESMLDALGILPQRKQHKKLLLQALVGEGSGEEQLFSSESTTGRDSIELDGYLQKLKEKYGVLCSFPEVVMSSRLHRNQVLDALVSLFCRSNISAETLWDGGWLLRQLLPYSETEFNSHHLKLLKDSYKNCTSAILEEIRGIWPDLIITVLCDEWKKCKRVIEASSPRRDPKCLLLPLQNSSSDDILPGESSFIAGERMCELVKVFILLLQLQIFSLGPKPGTELKYVDAVPCRIAFERGKERYFRFLAISVGTSGWLVLAEELPLKQQCGIIRVVAPLAGSNPRIDEKHSRWLHLRIRPSTLPFTDSAKATAYSKLKAKALVDGRWTLAFRDEESCKSALSMILEEMNLQSVEVERRLRPLLDLERALDSPHPPEASSPRTTSSNSS
ncbi:hypothetical protein Q3G72_031319 [Acer saccharum]|nr:hypothetical protein Q3G72_031319 [Acer saccharum]